MSDVAREWESAGAEKGADFWVIFNPGLDRLWPLPRKEFDATHATGYLLHFSFEHWALGKHRVLTTYNVGESF